MSKELNIFRMLDFSEKDLTAPNQVVEEILKQLPENTQKIIFGQICEYDGAALSVEYDDGTPSWLRVFSAIKSKRYVEIQKNLGKQGEKDQIYECFLYTSGYADSDPWARLLQIPRNSRKPPPHHSASEPEGPAGR